MSSDFIWARVRNSATDKIVGRSTHLIDTQGERRTLCGVEGVSPDATLRDTSRCQRCATTLKFHPEVTVRER